MLIINSQWRGFYSAIDLIYTIFWMDLFSISACQHKTDYIKTLSYSQLGEESISIHSTVTLYQLIRVNSWFSVLFIMKRSCIFWYLCSQAGWYKTGEYTPKGHIPHTLLMQALSSLWLPNPPVLLKEAAYHSTTPLSKHKQPSSPD